MGSIDDVKSRLDIVDIVGGYVALKKAGRNLKAPCPFHNEKTPSFIVTPERQSWHCFGACATGGDAITFVMRMENLDFGAALRRLADKVGVTLDSPSKGRAETDRNEALYRINKAAARFYQDTLKGPQGERARAYLEGRGVDTAACERFELGLSPASWEGLRSHLLGLGYDEEQAVLAGVLRRADAGNTYDFFHDRLMFPIHDRRGRVAGFGGRTLDPAGDGPKYLNTAQTDIFNKRDTLYALHLASQGISSKKMGIVVEGYMDVIAAHQHGYTNVVASMGTALTEQQVYQLKSLAKDFVLALDPDAAGQEATLRSLESSWRIFERQSVGGRRRPSVGVLFQREPLRLRIAALPPGQDPDALIRRDPLEWERLTDGALPLLEYMIPAVASRFDTSTGHGKTQAVETLFPLIASIQDAFDQERYLSTLAQTLDVSDAALRASIGRLSDGAASQSTPRREASVSPDASARPLSRDEVPLEEFTLSMLLQRPELREVAMDFSPQCFHRSENREIFTQWQSSTTMEHLRESLDPPLQGHLDELSERELVPAESRESRMAAWQCLQRLERRHLQELQEGLLASDEAGAPPSREIEGAVAEVNARLKELFSGPTTKPSSDMFESLDDSST